MEKKLLFILHLRTLKKGMKEKYDIDLFSHNIGNKRYKVMDAESEVAHIRIGIDIGHRVLKPGIYNNSCFEIIKMITGSMRC